MASFLRKLCDLQCRSGNVVSVSLRSCHVAIQGVQFDCGSNNLIATQQGVKYGQGKPKYNETQQWKLSCTQVAGKDIDFICELVKHRQAKLKSKGTSCCTVSCTQDVRKDIDFICKLVSNVTACRSNHKFNRALEYHGFKKHESSKKAFDENIYIWYSGVIALSGLIFNHGWLKQQKDQAVNTLSVPPSLQQVLKDYFWGLSSDHLLLKVNAKPVKEIESKPKHDVEKEPVIQADSAEENCDQDLLAETISRFSKLKEESVTEVLNTLGVHLSHTSQEAKAFNLFKQAASHGDPTALFNVALCYENGRGVAQSLHKAIKYYRLAADKGHSKAMYNLANIYINKQHLSKDEQAERLVFVKSAAEQKMTQAQRFLGVFYAKGQNWDKALRYFKLAGEAEDPVSLYNAGLCCERGLGTKKNLGEAMSYYLRAAKKGHRNSQFNVGVAYEKGLGGMKCDALQAIFWYTKASIQGDMEAQSRLENIRPNSSTPKTREPVRKSTLQVPLLPQWSIFGKDFHKSFSSPNLLSGFSQKAGFVEQVEETSSDVKEHSLIMVANTVL